MTSTPPPAAKPHEFTTEELAHLKAAFDTFDEDHSLTIDATELGKVLALLGREATAGDILRMIASVDSDGTGSISFDSFLQLMWRRKKEKEALDIYRQAFRVSTHNATQKLNASELKSLMHNLGLDASQEEVDEMLFEADNDEDHYLSFEEFVTILQRALTDGMKSPSRRGWTVEHNHAMENWIKVANSIGNIVNQSACARKCLRPQRLFRAVTYSRSTVRNESAKSIQAVISQCREGDTILLAEGTYTEPFIIHHDGMIVGAQPGAKVTIEVNSKQPAVTIKSRYAKLSGVTIVNRDGPGVSIELGYSDLENLSISGAQVGVIIRNRSFPSIVGCNISNCVRGAGILLKESRANVENCQFTNNFDGAVVAERSCNPWVSGCTIEGGHGSGIVFTEGALGVVANCKITGNGTQGIYVDNASNPIIWRCTITDNKASGAKFISGARATVEECEFGGNGDHDIDALDDGAPLVSQCKFTGGPTTAVSITKKAGVTLERCVFNGIYPLTAVSIDDSRAVIVDNKFITPVPPGGAASASSKVGTATKVGLSVDNNSTGKASDNSFVGWAPGIHEGRAAIQFSNSPAFQYERNVVQLTAQNAEAESIVNLLGGDIMRRKSLKVPK